MGHLPKILVCCPTYDGKNYCVREWMDNVAQLTYPKSHYDVFLADNSKTNANAKWLMKTFRVNAHWKDYGDMTALERLAEGHNICRDKMLDGNYDYMLHLESDIFPPHNIIEELLFARKDVVGAMYDLDHGAIRQPCVSIKALGRPFHGAFNHSGGMVERAKHFIDGRVHQANSIGLGCALIHRRVLKDVVFRNISKEKYNELKGKVEHSIPAPDTFFYDDIAKKGFKTFIHTGQLAFHWNIDNWGVNAETIKQEKTE